MRGFDYGGRRFQGAIGQHGMRSKLAHAVLSMRIVPAREALAAGALFVVLGVTAVWVTWRVAEQNARDAIGGELRRLAATTVTAVDLARHAQLTAPAQIDTPAYLAAVAPLRAMLRADPDIRYVYTFVQRPDGVYFVLDGSPPGDHDGDGREDRAGVFEAYPAEQVPAALRAMLRTRVVTVTREPYTDAWGRFMAGFAPLVDPADGALVGGLGVEITASRFEGRLALARRAAWLGAAVIALGGLFVALMVYRLRRAAAGALSSLDDVVARLEGALEEARRASSARTAFLATMSHELRTPMNGVIATIELLQGTGLTAEQRALLDTTRRSSEALLSILSDVLDLTKIEADHLEVSPQPTEVIDLVEEVVELFADRAEAAALRVRVTLGDGLPRVVRTDPKRLRQVLSNLVGNAVKFTERGEVEVAVSRLAPDRIEIAVRDTGIGIAPERVGLLGQPFTQLDQSFDRRFQGTGLGLAISMRLVRLLGGELSVESAPGVGSCFAVRLPVASDAPRFEPPRLDGLRVHVVGAEDADAHARALQRQGAEVTRGAAHGDIPARIDVLCWLLPPRVDDALAQALRSTITRVPRAVLLAPRRAVVSVSEALDAASHVRVVARPGRLARLLDALRGADAEGGVSVAARALKLRVLFVEDLAINLELTRMMLERLGCEVTTAENGQEALDRLAESAFDAVLMDCQMPLMDGFEAVRRWRASEPPGARTPVIALTANAFDEDRQRSLEAGMDGHLTKPVRMDELRSALLSWAPPPAASASAPAA